MNTYISINQIHLHYSASNTYYWADL